MWVDSYSEGGRVFLDLGSEGMQKINHRWNNRIHQFQKVTLNAKFHGNEQQHSIDTLEEENTGTVVAKTPTRMTQTDHRDANSLESLEAYLMKLVRAIPERN